MQYEQEIREAARSTLHDSLGLYDGLAYDQDLTAETDAVAFLTDIYLGQFVRTNEYLAGKRARYSPEQENGGFAPVSLFINLLSNNRLDREHPDDLDHAKTAADVIATAVAAFYVAMDKAAREQVMADIITDPA